MLGRMHLQKKEKEDREHQSNFGALTNPHDLGFKIPNPHFRFPMILKGLYHKGKMVRKRIREENNTLSVLNSSSLAKNKRRTNQVILSPFPVVQKFPFYSNIVPDPKIDANPILRIFHFPPIFSNRTDLWKHEEEEDEAETYKRFVTYEEFSKEWERTHPPPPKKHTVSMSMRPPHTDYLDMFNKRVRFTIPDLSQREISTTRMLRGPRPLRVEREVTVEEEKIFLHKHKDRGRRINHSFGFDDRASNPKQYYRRDRLTDYNSSFKLP